MLVLSRRIGERLHLGDNVVIEVKRISGCRVTLGIDAPRELRILRGELVKAAEEFEEAPVESPALANGAPVPVGAPLPVEPYPVEPYPVEPYVVANPPVSSASVTPGW